MENPYRKCFIMKSHIILICLVFGCLCYAHISTNNKFHSRSRQCIFLNYPYGQRKWKVFKSWTKDIFFARNVHFVENDFPYQIKSSPSRVDSETPSADAHDGTSLDFFHLLSAFGHFLSPPDSPLPNQSITSSNPTKAPHRKISRPSSLQTPASSLKNHFQQPLGCRCVDNTSDGVT